MANEFIRVGAEESTLFFSVKHFYTEERVKSGGKENTMRKHHKRKGEK